MAEAIIEQMPPSYYLSPSCSIEGEKINSLSRHGLVTDPQGLVTVIVRAGGKLRDAIREQ